MSDSFAELFEKKKSGNEETTFDKMFNSNEQEILKNGKTLPLKKTFESRPEIRGALKVTTGFNGSDFICHIAPAIKSRPWRVSIEIAMGVAVRDVLNKFFPRDQEMVLIPPDPNWEIPDFTIKVINATELWSVSKDDFEAIHEKFFEVMSGLLQEPRNILR